MAASTVLNRAVAAPIPIASVALAVIRNERWCSSVLAALANVESIPHLLSSTASDQGQTGVRPGSDRGQTRVRPRGPANHADITRRRGSLERARMRIARTPATR